MFHLDASVTELGLVALAFVSSATALVAQPHGGAFSLDAIASTSPQFDFTAERNRLASKYPATSLQEKRQARTHKQQGSVVVHASSSGFSFLVPTVVGNQTFDMIFDTGSADFWVYSNESSIYQSLEHPTYVPTSSAELLVNSTWSITYAYGDQVSGVVFKDVVKVGPVVADKQSVQSATIIQSEFSSDGIVGLASSLLNTVKPVKQKTLFDTLAPTLKKKVFAANLRATGNGTWDFGYIDKSKYTGKIAYAPLVNGTKYWEIAVKEYAVGTGSFGSATIGSVIVDSGTSLVYLPQAVVEDYYSKIAGYEFTIGESHTFPCNSTIPDFRFKIDGGKVLSIPGKDINFAVYDKAKGTCAGAISSQLNSKYSILGNLFMKNYYVVHSWEQEDHPKMGFASH